MLSLRQRMPDYGGSTSPFWKGYRRDSMRTPRPYPSDARRSNILSARSRRPWARPISLTKTLPRVASEMALQCARLQSDARHEHHGPPAPSGVDESVVDAGTRLCCCASRQACSQAASKTVPGGMAAKLQKNDRPRQSGQCPTCPRSSPRVSTQPRPKIDMKKYRRGAGELLRSSWER